MCSNHTWKFDGGPKTGTKQNARPFRYILTSSSLPIVIVIVVVIINAGYCYNCFWSATTATKALICSYKVDWLAAVERDPSLFSLWIFSLEQHHRHVHVIGLSWAGAGAAPDMTLNDHGIEVCWGRWRIDHIQSPYGRIQFRREVVVVYFILPRRERVNSENGRSTSKRRQDRKESDTTGRKVIFLSVAWCGSTILLQVIKKKRIRLDSLLQFTIELLLLLLLLLLLNRMSKQANKQQTWIECPCEDVQTKIEQPRTKIEQNVTKIEQNVVGPVRSYCM